MAKYGVTYSCGHTGEVQLYGPHRERERKLDWLACKGLCSECYKQSKRAEADARGPSVLVRYIHVFDPAVEAERCEAEAIRAAIDVDALEELAEDRRPWDWAAKHRAATLKVATAQAAAKSKRQQPKRGEAYEIVVVDSYSAKELLKARGYRFERDAVSKDLLGFAAQSGWVKQCGTEAAAREELVWCARQGWPARGHSGPIERISDALGLGRGELLNGVTPPDTVAAATAAREQAKADRTAARQAAAARIADAQERESHAASFRVGTRSGAVRLVPPAERTDERPWDLRIEATDGRIAWGWASEDGWFVSVIERPDGALLTLPTGCRESDRIGQDARSRVPEAEIAIVED